MKRRRRRQPRTGMALTLGLILALAGLLIASPRHRALYSRLWSAPPSIAPAVTVPPPRAAVSRSPEPPPSTPAADRPRGFATPIAPEEGQRPAPAGRGSRQKIPPPPASPSAVLARVPQGGPGSQVVVRILDDLATRLPLSGAPPAWELKEFAGRAQVDVVRDEDRAVLRLASERTSFALYRDVVLDVKEFPLLSWSWKVTKLPGGGDIRERALDDQAGQVYVIFPRWPHPRINSDVLGYIWDSRAPVGLHVTSPQSANVKLVVLESGAERLGQWVRE